MSEADARKWDAKYTQRARTIAPPSPFVLELLARLPSAGRCLDVAGGSGRNARPLAVHGLQVTIADASRVGLEIAEREAREAGLRIATVCRDIERDGLPSGRFDVIVQIHFLHRPLFEAYTAALVPGGLLLLEHPTRRNLERHARPPIQWLLEEGELASQLAEHAPGLEVLACREGWGPAGRHAARLLARRPG